MQKIKRKTLIAILGGIFIFVAADLLTKTYAADNFATNPLQILPFFRLIYVQNTGIAWSIAIPQLILIPLNLMLLAAIPFYMLKYLDLTLKISKISLSLIVAGAIGNLVDRLAFGHVRDFISIGWWPIFNLADSFLCIGIFLILVFYGKIKRI